MPKILNFFEFLEGVKDVVKHDVKWYGEIS
jgi:hypothetical protein